MVVAPPYEFFEAKPGQEYTWRILRYELGATSIAPRFPGAPPEKTVEVMRIHLDPASKPTYPPHWDLTSKHLIAMLKGYLGPPPGPERTIRFRWIGEGVRGRPALMPSG